MCVCARQPWPMYNDDDDGEKGGGGDDGNKNVEDDDCYVMTGMGRWRRYRC